MKLFHGLLAASLGSDTPVHIRQCGSGGRSAFRGPDDLGSAGTLARATGPTGTNSGVSG